MTLTESIVEDAALEWFGNPPATLSRSCCGQGMGYAVGHGLQMAPGEPAAERESFAEVVQSRVARTLIPTFSQREKEEEREPIRRPVAAGPAIPEEASS